MLFLIQIAAPDNASEQQLAEIWLNAVKPVWMKLEALVEV